MAWEFLGDLRAIPGFVGNLRFGVVWGDLGSQDAFGNYQGNFFLAFALTIPTGNR